MDMEGQGLEDPEILKRIQEIEAEVEQMTQKAMVDARRMMMQAREQADCLLLERRQAMEQASGQLLQEGIRAAEQEAAVMIGKARAEAQEVKERATAKIEEAADLVLQRVFPELKAESRKLKATKKGSRI